MFPLGTGVGLIMPVLMVALQNAAEQKDLGAATSSNVFFRSMGSSFGVAIFGAIMSAQLAYWIPRLVPKRALHISARGGLQPGRGPPPARTGAVRDRRTPSPIPFTPCSCGPRRSPC